MDVRKIFRDVVTNRYIPDLAYCSRKFSFQTVFNNPVSKLDGSRYECQPKLQYCYCFCGLELECLKFISDFAEINEVIYKRVIENIIDGKCKHVEYASKEYIGKAEIYAIHIAAAVGTLEALTNPKNQHPVYGYLLCMDPYQMAVFKSNHAIVSRPFMRKYSANYVNLVDLYMLPIVLRDKDDENCVRIERISMLEFCVMKGNILLLKSFVKLFDVNSMIPRQPGYFAATLNKALGNKSEMLDTLVNLLEFPQGANAPFMRESFEVAIVYNNDSLLDQLLALCGRNIYLSQGPKDRLTLICFVLKRKTCSVVLKNRLSISASYKMKKSEIISALLLLLYKYDFLRDEILETLRCIDIPNIFEQLNMLTEVHWYKPSEFPYSERNYCWLLKIYLDLGFDIDSDFFDSEGKSFINYLFSRDITDPMRQPSRQPVELFIYENPNLALNESAVSTAIDYDSEMRNRQFNIPVRYNMDVNRYLYMDGREHSWFGYVTGEDFALNFMAPLLIACGFPISNDVPSLLESLKSKLHQQEYEYISHHLQTPKLLTLCCRDALRHFYRGRKIHQFVQAVKVPKSVKDFILLKHVLKYVPRVYLR